MKAAVAFAFLALNFYVFRFLASDLLTTEESVAAMAASAGGASE